MERLRPYRSLRASTLVRANRRPTSFTKRRPTGFTLIETLIAAMLVGVCLAAIVSMWYFSFRLTVNADAQGVGYNLGRRAMEEVKETGFQDTAEGSSTYYYDNQGSSKSATRASNHAYSVTTAVASDNLVSGQPTSSSLRTVTVTVNALNTGQTVYQISTYLARAGI